MIGTNVIGDVVLFATTAGAVLSVLLYSRVPWYKSPIGRHVMSYMSAIASVLVTVSIRNIIGPFPLYDYLRLGTFSLVGVVVWWRLFVLIRARRNRAYITIDNKENYHGE